MTVSRDAIFIDALNRSMISSNSALCVGLDPLPTRLPAHLQPITSDTLMTFCLAVIDGVHEHVCAFKPQLAHFAALGYEAELVEIIQHIHDVTDVPVILDAKYGDIGTTAERYAVAAFERFGADAVTVSPFLGWDTVEPFLHYDNCGVIVLCRTSNPNASWLQNYPSREPTYRKIARRVHECGNRNLLLVVGATAIDELREVREIAPFTTLLVPGVGAQGGNLEQVMRYGRTRDDGFGVIVNVSRDILYAGSEENYVEVAIAKTREYAMRMSISSGE